ncbi:MAG: ABC transporter substrate-binding protein [Synergistaceae bacterium]|jgi:iron complex transport system substrate-binding protein|nr:ABC transporter substrate-binding protein [Synergistaceae bacterium]
MKKSSKKYLVMFIAAVVAVFVAAGIHVWGFGAAGAADEAEPRPFIDLAGRVVGLPRDPQRLATFVGPTPEKILLLGAADRLVGKNAYAVAGPWAIEVYPRFKDMALFLNPMDPNVEELIALDPDIIYYWSMPEQIEKMEAAGLTVVVTQLTSNNPATANEFIEFQKKEVNVIADSIGGTAKERARMWNSYFDRKAKLINDRVKNLKESERKKVYFGCSDDGLECFSKNSYPQFIVELAGGIFVAKNTNEEVNTTVTLEQIIAWDPDVIIMGRTDSTDGVVKDARWSEISAVKNGMVLLPPNGVMFWDYSGECVLLMQFLAKTLYPDLFRDIDMVKETQTYYKDFYGYDLSAQNARNILSSLPPAGK